MADAATDPVPRERFMARIADALRIGVDELWPADRPLGQVLADEISYLDIVMAIEDMNPYFHVPHQLDLRDATLEDLLHFCTVMGEGHAEEDI